MIYHKTCPVCNKEFTSDNHITKYCSHECFLASKRLRNALGWDSNRTCRQCGKPFTATNANERYCSNQCRATKSREHHSKILAENPPLTKCFVCGTEFKRIAAAKYCSDECRYKAKLANNLRYSRKPISFINGKEKRNCIDCKIQFEPINRNHQRCSSCSQQHAMKIALSKQRYLDNLRAIYLGDEEE